MRDAETVRFLQWALPRLRMRWRGFRRVRGQVGKRLRRRLGEQGLADLDAYRQRLESDDAEWAVLDGLCRITISRFGRDRAMWDGLRAELASRNEVRAWCAGCASGEEPYSLALTTRELGVPVRIVATDADAHLLERARIGRYPAGSLRELDPDVITASFREDGDSFVLDPALHGTIDWRCEDLRETMPAGPFDLILCRNLVFTYHDEERQRELLSRMLRRLTSDGILGVGTHEVPPSDELETVSACLYRRRSASERDRHGDEIHLR